MFFESTGNDQCSFAYAVTLRILQYDQHFLKGKLEKIQRSNLAMLLGYEKYIKFLECY